MSERRLLDTNVIIRHLTHDDERLSKAAGRLFAACDRGEKTLVILPVVLAECVFLLESFYKKSRGDIAAVLTRLITSPGIAIDEPAIYVDALTFYGRMRLHFVDCVIAAHATRTDQPVASFDSDFRKFPGVQVAID